MARALGVDGDRRWKSKVVIPEPPLNLQYTLTPNVWFDRPCPWTGAGRRIFRASRVCPLRVT